MPFLVGANPRVSSFANIPVAPISPPNNQEAQNLNLGLQRSLATKGIFKLSAVKITLVCAGGDDVC